MRIVAARAVEAVLAADLMRMRDFLQLLRLLMTAVADIGSHSTKVVRSPA